MILLMALVQSVIRRFPKPLCPTQGRIHSRTCGLLKVREGKYRGKPEGRESASFLQAL
jgi:hypothetical protein